MPPGALSFLVRLWAEPRADGTLLWRGWIQHIQSGLAIYFSDTVQMLKFIQQRKEVNCDAVPDHAEPLAAELPN